MKKFTNILFAFAIVLVLQAGASIAYAANAGANYDKYKDPSYGNFDGVLDQWGQIINTSGSGRSQNDSTVNGKDRNKTTSVSSLNDRIKALLDKIAGLQSEVSKVKGQVDKLLKDGLKQGMTDDDIKKIQELLAGDKAIYPEGEITGFFGEKTKEAIKRFQKKHGLEETGEVGPQTKKLLDEYLKEKGKLGSKWQLGKNFFEIDDVKKNVRNRLCKNPNALTVFCKGFNGTHATTTHATSTSNGDNCEYSRRVICNVNGSDFSNVKVKVVAGTTTVTFKIGTTTHTVVVKSKVQSVVLKAVADKLKKDLKNINSRFIKLIKNALEQELSHSTEGRLQKRAESAIARAEKTIAAVASDITHADADVDTDVAVAKLDEANDLLASAKVKLAASDFKTARELAKDAEDKADDAADALDDAD